MTMSKYVWKNTLDDGTGWNGHQAMQLVAKTRERNGLLGREQLSL